MNCGQREYARASAARVETAAAALSSASQDVTAPALMQDVSTRDDATRHVAARDDAASDVTTRECCEYCGDDALVWRKCKQLCTTCHQINRSCADL